eukprot:SAG31_NODE_761_length_12276_cov_4.530673_14_plen_176_part_00
MLSWGRGYGGALGHNDDADQATPKLIEALVHDLHPRYRVVAPNGAAVLASAPRGEEIDRLRQGDVFEAKIVGSHKSAEPIAADGGAGWVERQGGGWVCTLAPVPIVHSATGRARTHVDDISSLLLHERSVQLTKVEPKLPIQRVHCGGIKSMAFSGKDRAVRNWLAQLREGPPDQ